MIDTMLYDVIDTHTKCVIATLSKAAARKKRDALDAKYGAVRYVVRLCAANCAA